MGKPRIRVLIVDDSAVVRQTLTEVLSEDPAIEVIGAASDPFVAAERMREQVPDVITLDIEMPRMDGLTFLRKIMSQHPIPVVICSSLAEEGAQTTLKALEYGAVEIVAKPRFGTKQFLEESRVVLCNAVKAAAAARLGVATSSHKIEPKLTADAILSRATGAMLQTTEKVVVIGASTGGTEALRALLEVLPPDSPGIVIVQHMPEVFTRAFANRLDGLCQISVKEAETNDTVLRGRALIARGDQRASAQNGIVGLRLLDGNLAQAVQTVGKRPGENFRHVLHDDNPRRVGGQDFEQRAKGLGAAGRRADDDDLLGGLEHGARGPGENGIGGQLRFYLMARRGNAQAGCRGCLDSIAENDPRLLQELFSAKTGLGDNFHGAVLKRFKRGLRTFFRQTGANDHWYGVLGHDFPQECQAVHAGHLNVQRDHVGNLFAHPLGSDEGIAGRADYLDGRIFGQDFGQGLANHRGIVNDEDANSRLAHGVILRFLRMRVKALFMGSDPATRSDGRAALHPFRYGSEFCGRGLLPSPMRTR